MSITNFMRQRMLRLISRQAATQTAAADLHLGFLTTMPTSEGTGAGGVNGCVEWSDGRISIGDESAATAPYLLTGLGAGGGFSAVLQGPASITVTTGGETLLGWGLFDASTSGNLLASGAFTTPVAVAASTTLFLDTGDIEINLYTDPTEGD
jgi:hypothetical protein